MYRRVIPQQFIAEVSQCRTCQQELRKRPHGRVLLSCCLQLPFFHYPVPLPGVAPPTVGWTLSYLENVPQTWQQASSSVDIPLPRLTNWQFQFKWTKITNLGPVKLMVCPSQFKEFGDTCSLSTGSMLRTSRVICTFTLELNVASNRPFDLQCRHEHLTVWVRIDDPLFCLTLQSNAC